MPDVSPKRATPTLSCSRLSTRPNRSPRELDELAGHRAFEAVDARDAVADGEHRARLRDERGLVDVLDLLLDDLGDLFGSELHRDLEWKRERGLA